MCVCIQVYGDKKTLVGIGYYQTISTRSAGTQLIDLVHVADVADVLVAAIGGPYGIVTFWVLKLFGK